MSDYTGGCTHVHTHSSAEPIDNHVCHCNVCKAVTGQQTTHVVFFNDNNPDGPLELCTCADCGAAIMLDDRQKRIRVAVPNVMGYDAAHFPVATYHAFYDDTKGYPKPSDGRPVYEGLRPEFVWPKGA